MTTQSSPLGVGSDGATSCNDPIMGVWEPACARGIHITFARTTRDAAAIDAYPVASKDGESFVDDGTWVVVTLCDTSGAVKQVVKGVPRVTGVRVRPGKPRDDEVIALIAANAAANSEARTPTA